MVLVRSGAGAGGARNPSSSSATLQSSSSEVTALTTAGATAAPSACMSAPPEPAVGPVEVSTVGVVRATLRRVSTVDSLSDADGVARVLRGLSSGSGGGRRSSDSMRRPQSTRAMAVTNLTAISSLSDVSVGDADHAARAAPAGSTSDSSPPRRGDFGTLRRVDARRVITGMSGSAVSIPSIVRAASRGAFSPLGSITPATASSQSQFETILNRRLFRHASERQLGAGPGQVDPATTTGVFLTSLAEAEGESVDVHSLAPYNVKVTAVARLVNLSLFPVSRKTREQLESLFHSDRNMQFVAMASVFFGEVRLRQNTEREAELMDSLSRCFVTMLFNIPRDDIENLIVALAFADIQATTALLQSATPLARQLARIKKFELRVLCDMIYWMTGKEAHDAERWAPTLLDLIGTPTARKHRINLRSIAVKAQSRVVSQRLAADLMLPPRNTSLFQGTVSSAMRTSAPSSGPAPGGSQSASAGAGAAGGVLLQQPASSTVSSTHSPALHAHPQHTQHVQHLSMLPFAELASLPPLPSGVSGTEQQQQQQQQRRARRASLWSSASSGGARSRTPAPASAHDSMLDHSTSSHGTRRSMSPPPAPGAGGSPPALRRMSVSVARRASRHSSGGASVAASTAATSTIGNVPTRQVPGARSASNLESVKAAARKSARAGVVTDVHHQEMLFADMFSFAKPRSWLQLTLISPLVARFVERVFHARPLRPHPLYVVDFERAPAMFAQHVCVNIPNMDNQRVELRRDLRKSQRVLAWGKHRLGQRQDEIMADGDALSFAAQELNVYYSAQQEARRTATLELINGDAFTTS